VRLLTRLNPRDFAAVSRRMALSSRKANVSQLVEELRAEATARGCLAAIGFR
jgi:hypothetical protein